MWQAVVRGIMAEVALCSNMQSSRGTQAGHRTSREQALVFAPHLAGQADQAGAAHRGALHHKRVIVQGAVHGPRAATVQALQDGRGFRSEHTGKPVEARERAGTSAPALSWLPGNHACYGRPVAVRLALADTNTHRRPLRPDRPATRARHRRRAAALHPRAQCPQAARERHWRPGQQTQPLGGAQQRAGAGLGGAAAGSVTAGSALLPAWSVIGRRGDQEGAGWAFERPKRPCVPCQLSASPTG